MKLKSGRRLQADKVLFSTGRSGNTKGLDLEKLGVALTERGHVRVNEHFQTAVPNIYAAGVVIGFPALASTAMEQGRVAACHAFQIAYKTGVSPFQPYGIYSIPEISTIGPSEQELAEKGIAYEIGHARFENNPRGQIIGDADGFIKILFDPESRKLLAAHILGSTTELIHIPCTCSPREARSTSSSTRSQLPDPGELRCPPCDGCSSSREHLAVRRGLAGARARRPTAAVVGWPCPISAGRGPAVICMMDRFRRCRLSPELRPDARPPCPRRRGGFV